MPCGDNKSEREKKNKFRIKTKNPAVDYCGMVCFLGFKKYVEVGLLKLPAEPNSTGFYFHGFIEIISCIHLFGMAPLKLFI
jgi:hypothetical protein